MARRPRKPDEPILSRNMIIWLVGIGLIMGVGTLGVISWGEQEHNKVIAHTMGLVTFSLFNLLFSLAVKDEYKTAFSLDTLSDKVFIKACGVSILTIILATLFGPLQRFLETTSLDVQQWIICICVALSVLVASEIRKAVLRRSAPQAAEAEAEAQAALVGTPAG